MHTAGVDDQIKTEGTTVLPGKESHCSHLVTHSNELSDVKMNETSHKGGRSVPMCQTTFRKLKIPEKRVDHVGPEKSLTLVIL